MTNPNYNISIYNQNMKKRGNYSFQLKLINCLMRKQTCLASWVYESVQTANRFSYILWFNSV